MYGMLWGRHIASFWSVAAIKRRSMSRGAHRIRCEHILTALLNYSKMLIFEMNKTKTVLIFTLAHCSARLN